MTTPANAGVVADKVAMAGALQGFPVDIVKAKTVDAYAIAESEWVIEGHLEVERVWESEEAEQLQRAGVAPFFPEWPGYLGRSYRFRKFRTPYLCEDKLTPSRLP